MTFSLVIPVYNVEPYIRKCLDSVIHQDFGDWEALLIDDGSTDSSGNICDEYAARDKRFRVFHKPNGGVSSARNMALDNARGEWIWFVDPDDWIMPSALNRLATVAGRYCCDTILFGIEYYNTKGQLLGSDDTEDAFGKSKDEVISESDYPPVCYLLRRSIVENAHLRFTEGVSVGEDLEFQYKYFMLCQRPVSAHLRLYGCLRREGSATCNPRTLIDNAVHIPNVLGRLVDFVESYNIAESKWLAARLNRVFKSAMSSNYLVRDFRDGLQQKIRNADRRLMDMGFFKYRDAAVKAAVTDMRLYFAYQRLRKFLKR